MRAVTSASCAGERGAGGGGAAVLPDDGAVDRRAGARSQISVVSRWLVMPIAATSADAAARLGERLAQHGDGVAPEILGVVLDPAGGAGNAAAGRAARWRPA